MPIELFNYHRYLEAIAEADIAYIKRKDVQYRSSWKQRGGAGAFFTIVRPLDRFEGFAARHPLPYDIFDYMAREGLEGPDGSMIACVRDARRYLMLLEAEMMEREGVALPGEGNAGFVTQPEPYFTAVDVMGPTIDDLIDKSAALVGVSRTLVREIFQAAGFGTPIVSGDPSTMTDRQLSNALHGRDPHDNGEFTASSMGAKQAELNRSHTPEDGGHHEQPEPIASHPPFQLVLYDWGSYNFARDAMYTEKSRENWVLDPYLEPNIQFSLQMKVTGNNVPANIRRRIERALALYSPAGRMYVLRVGEAPPEMRDHWPRFRVELNHQEWKESPEWVQSLYAPFDTTDNKYKMLSSYVADWAVE